MFHLISHVFYQNDLPIYGPINVLVTFLKRKKKKYTLVSLPLGLTGENAISGPILAESSPANYSHLVVKIINDLLYILRYCFKAQLKNKDTVIAVDPLNALIFSLFKPFIGYKLIYYTADYSDNRFGSKLLNFIYKKIDLFSLLMADQNWCVSSEIVKKRQGQGFHKKAYFLPNTPILSLAKSTQTNKNKNKIIYVGRMDNNMNLLKIIETVLLLKKKNKSISLILVGGGKLEKRILKLIKEKKLRSFITYKGPLENNEVIKQIKKSGIGLALYDGGNSWNVYGDSMKIREYQYFGLPVITTEIPSNSSEVLEYNCGVVLDESNFDNNDLVKAILAIQKSYDKYTKNTLKLAKNRDKDKILEGLLKI
jgi:glycosyltransferase involved in cell wall biosynthesis